MSASAGLTARRTKRAIALLLAASLLSGGAGLQVSAPAGATPVDPPTARPVGPADVVNKVAVSGRVLGPEGQPVVGATVRAWSDAAKSRTLVRTTTVLDGRFRLDRDPDLASAAMIVATADGLGPDWVRLVDPTRSDVTLRLAKDDAPIQGRTRFSARPPRLGWMADLCSKDWCPA